MLNKEQKPKECDPRNKRDKQQEKLNSGEKAGLISFFPL